jgi:hypothetical protein
MFELGVLAILLAVCWPLALLAGLIYFGFWVFSVSLKVTGAVLGVVLSVIVCVFVLAGLIISGILFFPIVMIMSL